MKKLAFIYFLALSVFCTATAQKHYTVVISLDGYRWDYTEWYDTPFMDMMADKGEVRSDTIIPLEDFPQPFLNSDWPVSRPSRHCRQQLP